ncbi:2-deoxy-D-gluconate 3-dehydrogenase [Prochlorococcus marinus str. MIT 9312]|uniref:2-deoxy-D-gluconate 3-dehydrogenase n=2 Tax=Prochlorococcaceae TaxID=2881426 RepID=Q319N5_PROM9|nr:SDR family oxidoreductase [Prochlorococcus marinus]ABB50410.1 2-deoxy-D-gluconate 3-dehydrogenase [Prochlorococcus marinus str. MIT 9312]
MSMFSVKNKRVLVVGASRGIGLEISIKLKEGKADILGIARSDINADFNYLRVDISNNKDILYLNKYIEQNNLFFDGIVVNSAISQSPKTFDNKENTSNKQKFTQNPRKFELINNINLISVYELLYTVSPYISKDASIIFISSIGSELGFPGNPGYQTSKAGINALVRALAVDLSRDRIRVNHLNLGYINAPMSKDSYNDKKMNKERSERTILKRWGSIEDVIGPVIFLLSNESSYITGTGINVDGGWLSKGL